MNLFECIGHQPVRTEPGVWISRVVIFGKLAANEREVIRDIPLSRGLNIVWAKAVDSKADTARIAGHSAGKTTFCRFIRYLLGESTFGTKAVMEAIRRSFPLGCVAAEIHISGRRWAVRRPLGSGRTHIMEDASVEDLLGAGGIMVSQEEYAERIGLNGLLDKNDAATSQIVQTGEAITWEHVLAWCSRDQECRFQSLHAWRVQQSESETPSFRSRKAGPLFAIRALLGLYLPDELRNEERLAECKREKAELEKAIEDAIREPKFRVNLYRRHLLDFLRDCQPEESDNLDALPFDGDNTLFPQSLSGFAKKAKESIEKEIAAAVERREAAQLEIDTVNVRMQLTSEAIDRWETPLYVGKLAKNEVNPELSPIHARRAELLKWHKRQCPWGGIIIGECPEVLRRQKTISINDVQDEQVAKQTEAEKADESARIEREVAPLRNERSRLSIELKTWNKERDDANISVQDGNNRLRDLDRIMKEHGRWSNWNDNPHEFALLHRLRGKRDRLDNETTRIERDLAEALTQHNADRDLLSTIFSQIVKGILPGNRHDGVVTLDDSGIAFRIKRDSMMSGEAISTMAVLWADLAAMIYTCVREKSRLPGILLHDSPREADLDIGVYHAFIDFVGAIQDCFTDEFQIPYQYILTSTTEPPEKYRDGRYLKLPLDASDPEGLLLRCDVGISESGLFKEPAAETP